MRKRIAHLFYLDLFDFSETSATHQSPCKVVDLNPNLNMEVSILLLIKVRLKSKRKQLDPSTNKIRIIQVKQIFFLLFYQNDIQNLEQQVKSHLKLG